MVHLGVVPCLPLSIKTEQCLACCAELWHSEVGGGKDKGGGDCLGCPGKVDCEKESRIRHPLRHYSSKHLVMQKPNIFFFLPIFFLILPSSVLGQALAMEILFCRAEENRNLLAKGSNLRFSRSYFLCSLSPSAFLPVLPWNKLSPQSSLAHEKADPTNRTHLQMHVCSARCAFWLQAVAW